MSKVLKNENDNLFYIPVIEMSKIRKPTVIVDYGCGYGKLLKPMKNLEDTK